MPTVQIYFQICISIFLLNLDTGGLAQYNVVFDILLLDIVPMTATFFGHKRFELEVKYESSIKKKLFS